MSLIRNSRSKMSRASGRARSGNLLKLISILLLGCLLSSQLAAQPSYPALSAEDIPVPADMSAVSFYLITVDVGDAVWDNFGHTALRMYDQSSNTDLVFNWGIFDISGGPVAFSFNFFKGIMRYELDTRAPADEFAMYRDQQRSVWQDKINLTNPEKEVLYRRLVWNLEEENRTYDYLYFFNNCTTRVRDYLDEALGGKIRDQFAGTTSETFRDQVQAHYQSVSLIAFSLDVLMNSNIDRQVSEWEAMYLPLQLRESLAQVQSDVAISGRRQMLLSDHQEIISYAPPRQQADAYELASLILLAPVLFLMLMLKRIPMSYFATHSRVGLKLAPISFRLLGLLGLLTAVFSGVYGVLMLGSWFISDHLDLHHNLNLLLFWPTDLLGIVVALRWLIFCKAWPMTNNSGPFINYYILAHVLAMGAYVVIWYTGWSLQEVDDLVRHVLPGFILFTVLMWIVGFEPAKPKTMFF